MGLPKKGAIPEVQINKQQRARLSPPRKQGQHPGPVGQRDFATKESSLSLGCVEMPLALPTDTTAKLTSITEEDPYAIDSSSHHYNFHSIPRRRRHLLPLSAWKNLTFADFDKSPQKIVKKKYTQQGIMLGSCDTSPIVSKDRKKSSKHKKNSVKSRQSLRAEDSMPMFHSQNRSHNEEDKVVKLPPAYVQKPISASELTATTQDMTESERSHEDPVAVLAQQVQEKPKAKSTKKQKAKKEAKTTKTSKKQTKKGKKAQKQALTVSSIADDSHTFRTVDIERRLQEIEELEKMLMEERLALQSDQESISCDKAIMRYIIKEEVHRTDQMKSTIDALQARVQDMQRQELAVLGMDLRDRTNAQENMVELHALVDRQAHEIKQLRATKGELVIDENDALQDVQGLLEDNKALRKRLETLVEEHATERKEWEQKIASKENTISLLTKDLKNLKKNRSAHQQPERKTSLSTNSLEAKNNTAATKAAVTIDAPPSPKESVMHKLQTLMQPPSAPKSARKDKVAIQGMDIAALKPPLDDFI
jgi:hypothetical protein